MNAAPAFLSAVELGFFFAAAVCSGLAAAWSAQKRRSDLAARNASVAAMACLSLWCVAVAASGTWGVPGLLAEGARNVALIILAFALLDTQGQRLSLRPVLIVLCMVQTFQAASVAGLSLVLDVAPLALRLPLVLNIVVAIGALLLVHNLHAGAKAAGGRGSRPAVAAMAGFWAFELNYYAVVFLSQSPATVLGLLRGPVAVACVLGLLAATRQDRRPFALRPSRTAALQTLSLFGIAIYLLAMFALSELLQLLDGNAGRLAQIGVLVGGVVLALLWLPSRRMRAWTRVVLLKHLFRHRYDYRTEWQRFMETVGKSDDASVPLTGRIAKAIAEITSSPGASLYLVDEDGYLARAYDFGRHPLHSGDEGTETFTIGLARFLETDGSIIDCEAIRRGTLRPGEAEAVPAWMIEDRRCWALVPLMHYERLVGAVLLARPPDQRSLDWEDLDLLKLAGRQVASYLSEQAGHEALLQAGQFDQFNRRIAFVMHDIKNLASQLNLLARNAERHADKPEFRADMLVTLRKASGKLQTLIDRLGGYGTGAEEPLESVALAPLLANLQRRFAAQRPIDLTAMQDCRVMARRETLTQALVHLVQNAIDASPQGAPIQLLVQVEGVRGRIEIIDVGEGMSAEFIRNGLFRPFVSSRNGGFGIGAFEARELIRAMDGRLTVTSREGVGSRFVITLPLADAASILPAGHAVAARLNEVA